MYLDIFVILVLLILVFLGVRNGIFVEVLTIFGVMASFFISKKITPTVIEKTSLKIESGYYFIAYIVVFIICWMLITLIVHYLQRVFNGERKSPIIRILGGLIGFGRGALIVSIVLLAANIAGEFVVPVKEYIGQSKANELFIKFIPTIKEYLPSAIGDKLNNINNENVMNDKMSRLSY
ncbi:CvpA family protein [Fusobacterium sp. PH5-44]|uniref:CvpA family protein n=1 Tax=unclassified Fusobacterium TaxID=2648384 RepID=UPI003D1D6445